MAVINYLTEFTQRGPLRSCIHAVLSGKETLKSERCGVEAMRRGAPQSRGAALTIGMIAEPRSGEEMCRSLPVEKNAKLTLL